MAAGEGDRRGRAGRDRLSCRTRRPTDGGWDEEPFTGTGFPKVFYLKYHLYSLYFPLMALARYCTGQSHERTTEAQRTQREEAPRKSKVETQER